MNKKLGHQAPRLWRFNRYFHNIIIRGDLHYCYSHNFMFNCVEEERKLYNGEPCFYTDWRYTAGKYNYYKDCYLHFVRSEWGNRYELSLKACMRVVNQTRNIPVGTIVDFNHDWYHTTKKNKVIPMSYRFKVRKENVFDPQYEINLPNYSRNFIDCERSQKLTEVLRANGFIVGVSKGNPDFIMGMIGAVQEYTNGQRDADQEVGGQIATAYGHGMMIGFSSADNTYQGYSYGRKNILFDYFGEFDKWSQCHEIDKKCTPEEIIKRLLEPRNND